MTNTNNNISLMNLEALVSFLKQNFPPAPGLLGGGKTCICLLIATMGNSIYFNIGYQDLRLIPMSNYGDLLLWF